ncbi:low temperature requirement protein A [Cryobacterium algoritolerans]|uniref:Low temperature requirement protein A n=1 Tax=Cryobacterium algoritolerans TaxID=1259184 RepID=A0A4R8WV79_9MICO|nr:low temperature requirement protein A [Cryobacterium algoritolerans]TFC17936.1 low temperature requirement protein A [Cryobacterium algoritolerans]
MPHPRGSSPLSRAYAAAFRRHFWQPPRAHGDVIEGREVSFLELFYDLVYVVVIAQAAHHLAGHMTWAGVGQFAVVFGLIWFAWINGAVYHDLHGRADARTRFYVFAQMGVLVLLAVFTGQATSGDGPAFAIVYSAYLFLLGWLWYSVRRRDDPALRPVTTPYLVGVLGSAAIVGVSALVPNEARLAVWAILVVFWLAGMSFLQRRNGTSGAPRLNPSESMIERFDLFTIIVLGEVVVGVVNGIADANRTPIAVVTGMLGLGIGFAYWWTYFDLVGGRRVAADRGALARWLVGHLLVTMTIAATGGVMVSMIEQASGGHAPGPGAMSLSLSVAVGVLALILIATSLADWRDLAPVYRPVSVALGAAAVVALLIGWLAPQPWLHILLLTLVLGAVWLYSILTWFSFTHRED